MRIIPVIDIRNGKVVRAIAGRRDKYLPIVTPLARSCAPEDVVSGFLQLCFFKTVYVADLDAIEARGDNRAIIRNLIEANPRLSFVIDSGPGYCDWRGVRRVAPVIGSESLRDPDLKTLQRMKDDPHAVLSLDFREGFLGPEALLFSPELWPRRIIIMTLSRIGVGKGPDLNRIAHIRASAGERDLYAAGGVRGPEDLIELQRVGASGALVATALHDGRLTPDDLVRIHCEKHKKGSHEGPLL